MLGTQCRSRLVAFCDRVSKLEEVYVVAKRGKNSARTEQVWRLDDPEQCFDVGELMASIESRLLSDPSDLPTFVSALRYSSGERMDHVRIEPIDQGDDDGKADGGAAILHLTHTVVKLSNSIQTSAALDKASLQGRYDALLARYLEQGEELAQLRALQAVGLQAHELENGSGMKEAFQVLSPFVQVVLGKMLTGKKAAAAPKRIAGPAPEAPSPQETPPAEPIEVGAIDTSDWGQDDARALLAVLMRLADTRPELLEEHLPALGDVVRGLGVELPEVTGWTPERVDQVVELVEDVATHHLDLISDAHLERLITPLQERVLQFVLGGTS